ncbi:MAG: RNA polymerase sigma-54 factor [Thalassospira sp.]|uniref:RNA polymerase factor sigma-54 n=1 Tax=unclassified Thalassospira TaxID=2648997 RepID=UPI000C52441F|nr:MULTISPECIES: RNA polymerase factor sigma-54 [unclassified Thalassospira]MBE71359.1 RNA polymerase sigma-54 factor [Thalassospira sp.]QPO11721.1 RNA polymerase factor sigma-54 [Thalassospira sp. A40-3]|tara:strand:- start:58 stop:1647 length:1590 start_codon:yes stop_codon:yes gene_type:complete
MALKARLDLRQSQSLVMTPQLQQAIKLLQFNNIELSNFIDSELMENPLLERADPGQTYAEAGDGAVGNGDEGLDSRSNDNFTDRDDRFGTDRLTSSETMGSDDGPLDVSSDALYGGEGEITRNGEPVSGSHDYSAPYSGGAGGGAGGAGGSAAGGDDLPGLEQTLADEATLRQTLDDQLNIAFADAMSRMIGSYLIDMLDENGYISGDLDEVSESLECDIADVERVLKVMQGFDPVGIFARDLAECLELQLRELNRFDPAMAALLANLDLLAKRDFDRLRRVCGVDSDDLHDMIAEIKTLDPRPGKTADGEIATPVIPDVLMRAAGNGNWHLELNSEALPRVLVNEDYVAQIGSGLRDREERGFMSEKLQSANWLVKALHQRATTIMKVASEIVRQQDGFFTHGVAHLRPLILRDIAEAIGMHESTVSRVTNGKFMSTPRGMFELKYFFTTAISSSDGGDAYSSEAVRHRIKSLIDNEEPKKILSDDKLVELLGKEGIDIARRTVAKYREAMRIPSSVQRRREKKSRAS